MNRKNSLSIPSVPVFSNCRKGWICFAAVLSVHGLFVTWLMSKDATVPAERPVPLVGVLYGNAAGTVGRHDKGGASSKAALSKPESPFRFARKKLTRLPEKTTFAEQGRPAGKQTVSRLSDNTSSVNEKTFSGSPAENSTSSDDGTLNGSGSGGPASGTDRQLGSGNGTGGFIAPYTDASLFQNPKPPYPAASRRLGEEGEVILSVSISADGRVNDARVKRSSGFARLDKSALDTVKKWRYIPARNNGRPVAFRYVQPVRFALDD